MKIHVVVTVGPELFEASEEMYSAYMGLACARPGTELILKSLRSGLTALEHYDYKYFQLLNAQQVPESLLQAEKEGADAVVICCFFDPGLRNARGICKIPVLGIAESSMIFAAMMGLRFSIIVPRAGQIPIEEENLALYGMRGRAIDQKPVRCIQTEMTSDFSDEDINALLDDFAQVTRSCASDGAEVVIPGCSGLSMALAVSGVTEMEGLPIVDPIVSAVKLAEAMVDLNQSGRPWISRKLMYRIPPDREVEKVRKSFGIK